MNTSIPENLKSLRAGPAMNWRTVLRFVIVGAVVPLLLFAAAGRFDWWQAWFYTIVAVGSGFGSRYLLFRKNPALIAERARFTNAENIKSWDKRIVTIIAVVGPLAVYIVAGLDKRNGWSPEMAPGWTLVGILMLILGLVFSTWAMLVNPFFSSVVRIQHDRGQTVTTAGPYRIVRHPGYSGGIVAWLGMPVLLGTLWAFVPAGIVIVLYIVRTSLEDRALQAELPGYTEYTQNTRYRLLPGVW